MEDAKEATREIEAPPERFMENGLRRRQSGQALAAAGGISRHRGVSMVSIRVLSCHYHGKAKHTLRARRHQCRPGNQLTRAAGESKETVS